MDELESLFACWIATISLSSPPPMNIAAFNIGLFETPDGYKAYLTGSKDYDPNDDDWACQEDYSPEQRYFELPPDFIFGKDWQEIEEGMVEMVKKFLVSAEGSENIFSTSQVVTVGFDDGVLIRVK
jgi:hypothetical protein